jgi:hypothetical protein
VVVVIDVCVFVAVVVVFVTVTEVSVAVVADVVDVSDTLVVEDVSTHDWHSTGHDFLIDGPKPGCSHKFESSAPNKTHSLGSISPLQKLSTAVAVVAVEVDDVLSHALQRTGHSAPTATVAVAK